MDGRITRITFPTASFSLTREQIEWIESEAKRLGVKKSVLVRQIIEAAMQEREAA
jgi:predicted DNA-binding protein